MILEFFLLASLVLLGYIDSKVIYPRMIARAKFDEQVCQVSKEQCWIDSHK